MIRHLTRARLVRTVTGAASGTVSVVAAVFTLAGHFTD
jgi:hypothetical protein